MSQPLVSVIITTYNRSHLVCRAIDSVLSQTYKNIEIIVVDDCSTDGTEVKLREYILQLKYIRNMKNIGLAATRNVGIMASTGEYISFLDDDDEILPDKIKEQMAICVSRKGVDIVYCGSARKNGGTLIEWKPSLKGNIYPSVLKCTPNAIHTLLLHKSCFSAVGLFDETLIGFEDYDFWVRLSRFYEFNYIDKVLAIYHIHGYQMTSNIYHRIESMEKMLIKYQKEMVENREIYADYLRKLASRYALIGDHEKFKKNIYLAVKFNYFNPRAYVHLFLFFVSKALHRKVIRRYGLLKVGGVTLS